MSAYVWWYIRRSYGLIKENGNISKRGYCMAQYSKFVRPNDVRVELMQQNPLKRMSMFPLSKITKIKSPLSQ